MTSERGTRSAERLYIPLITAVLAASSSFAAELPQPLLVIGKPPVAARLAELSAAGSITFSTFADSNSAPVPTTVAPADLVAWGAPVEFGRRIYVVLADGGVLAADAVAATAETLEFASKPFEARSLPLSVVRGIVFHAPSARAARDHLFHSLATPGRGDRDRLILIGGDEVQGTLASLDGKRATIETSVGPAKPAVERIAALVFNPALAAKIDLPARRTVVGLRDGSLITASSVVGRERVRLSPIAAPPLAATDAGVNRPWEVDRDEIVFLQSFGGRATYLSDLSPAGYKHVPYLESSREYRLDRSSSDGDLRAGGRRYLKGVGMHSTSRLTFPLEEGHQRFEAEIAVDDETAGRGSVVFRVFVDAAERYRSEIVRGGDAPRSINVDVAGGKQLSLIVDFAEEADVQDHADWLNARLVK